MGSTKLESLSLAELFDRYRLAWRNVVRAEVEFSWRGAQTPEMDEAIITDRKNAKTFLAEVEIELLRRLHEVSGDDC